MATLATPAGRKAGCSQDWLPHNKPRHALVLVRFGLVEPRTHDSRHRVSGNVTVRVAGRRSKLFCYPYLKVATRFFALATIVLFAGACLSAAPATDRERFEKYIGKYPSNLLKGEPDVKRRLQTLLGANYSLFMERLQVESPIENVKGILVTKGCMAHGCGVEEAIILINLSDGRFHCAIRSDAYSDKVKTFSEDPAHLPAAALKYALEK